MGAQLDTELEPASELRHSTSSIVFSGFVFGGRLGELRSSPD
jgi:hypothetical protein